MTKDLRNYLIDCYLDDPFDQMIDLDHIGIPHRKDSDGKIVISKLLREDEYKLLQIEREQSINGNIFSFKLATKILDEHLAKFCFKIFIKMPNEEIIIFENL